MLTGAKRLARNVIDMISAMDAWRARPFNFSVYAPTQLLNRTHSISCTHVFLQPQHTLPQSQPPLESQGATQTSTNMNIHAKLTPAETAVFSNPDTKYQHAELNLRQLRLDEQDTPDFAGIGEENSFEESLRIKNTLDTIEEMTREAPSWRTLALLVNCELRLWRLNHHTPLRLNPFLTHWVDALMPLATSTAARKRAKATEPEITTEMIFLTRVGLIKSLLHGDALPHNPHDFSCMSPRETYDAIVRSPSQFHLALQPFDLSPYIRMLVEEGVLEADAAISPKDTLHGVVASPKDTSSDGASVSAVSTPLTSIASPRSNDFQQWKQDMLQKLQIAPMLTIPEITHLPLELSYLDFLTTLLTDRAFEAKSIEPAPVITSYIQHSLRLVEKMGRPPGLNPDVDNTAEEVVDHGPKAQSRAVKLLLLFIRNLIRKELVPAQMLYFEIQEICVRYVWIKEVREFKIWIEEGVSGEQDA